jgi:Protein of unknown function (DUF3102)
MDEEHFTTDGADHHSDPHHAVGDNRLAVLAADIRAAHAGVLDAAKTVAERAIDAGRALIEAKALAGHGNWLPWLQQHCGMSERTAQLYMQIAGLGLPAETIADLGLKAAAKAVVIEDHGYDPFFHCDEDAQRQWHLFVAFGVPWPRVEWLLNKQFVTPDEWLGPEGAKCRRAWGMREQTDGFKGAWAEFQHEQKGTPLPEIMAMAEEMETKRAEQQPSRPAKRRTRRRKPAPVADLPAPGGAP